MQYRGQKRVNYLIDVEHAVIVDVEATPARTFDEVAATRVMIDRTEPAEEAAGAVGRVGDQPLRLEIESPFSFRSARFDVS